LELTDITAYELSTPGERELSICIRETGGGSSFKYMHFPNASSAVLNPSLAAKLIYFRYKKLINSRRYTVLQ
jgi:hypothetical protein